MKDTAQRGDRKWRSFAPSAWAGNLWLLLVGWPMWSEGAALHPGLAYGSVLPVAVGAALLAFDKVALAAVAFLCAYPATLAAAVAARDEPEPLSILGLCVVTVCVWAYGASTLEALRPAPGPSGARIVALPEGRHRQSARVALATRAHRLRLGLTALFGVGALAIGVIAPSLGGPRALSAAWGDELQSGSVLVAMTGAALSCTVAGVFLSALLRPASASDRQPRSPLRVALSLMLAIVGATTYYVVHSG